LNSIADRELIAIPFITKPDIAVIVVSMFVILVVRPCVLLVRLYFQVLGTLFKQLGALLKGEKT
jgi:hypothetical protein